MPRRKHPVNRIFKRKGSRYWQAKFLSGGVIYTRTTRTTNEESAQVFLSLARKQYTKGPPKIHTCKADHRPEAREELGT